MEVSQTQEPPFLMGEKARNNDRGDGTTLNLSTMPKKLSEKMHEERLRKFISGERSGESSSSTLKIKFHNISTRGKMLGSIAQARVLIC